MGLSLRTQHREAPLLLDTRHILQHRLFHMDSDILALIPFIPLSYSQSLQNSGRKEGCGLGLPQQSEPVTDKAWKGAGLFPKEEVA